MQKNIIRSLKSHYGDRWRCDDNSIHSQILRRMMVPGQTMALECGLVYPENLNIQVDSPGHYHNILALNPIRFKYKTLFQLKDHIVNLQKQTVYNGRILVSFNFQFVNFNRLQQDFYQELNIWINELRRYNLLLKQDYTKFLPRTNNWGDCFFIFENHEISNSNLLQKT
jgi:hypothetical protein